MNRTLRCVSLSVVFSAALVLSACSAGPSRVAMKYSEQTEPIAEQSATVRMAGLSCPLCANNVEEQLTKLPSVQDVDLDLGTGVAKVTFLGAPHASRAEIERAVVNSGFTLVEIQTP